MRRVEFYKKVGWLYGFWRFDQIVVGKCGNLNGHVMECELIPKEFVLGLKGCKEGI